ncbi:MAG TPA: hypothetical protein VMZ28_30695 [Kofleriaceae bacterium]|nr:hypothetical protein [Kofleriaceae bacterium]
MIRETTAATLSLWLCGGLPASEARGDGGPGDGETIDPLLDLLPGGDDTDEVLRAAAPFTHRIACAL